MRDSETLGWRVLGGGVFEDFLFSLKANLRSVADFSCIATGGRVFLTSRVIAFF